MPKHSTTSSDRRAKEHHAVAYHEAGHAVAAWCKELKFRYVTVKPDAGAGSLGHVLCGFPKWFQPDVESSDRIRLHAERHIIVNFAGQHAETRFRGKRPRYGMYRDNKQTVELASYLFDLEETMEAYLHYCFLASRDLVATNWAAIKAVAAALLERQTLSRRDVIEAIYPGSTVPRKSLKRAPAATTASDPGAVPPPPEHR